MNKSLFMSSGHAPQTEGDHIELDNTSFDGDDFEALGMEFHTEDLVSTFLDPADHLPNQIPEEPEELLEIPQDKQSIPPEETRKKNGLIKGPSRRKKRPKGKPRRPLCGYNIFFQKHSKEIQPTTAFKDLGRIMGERWKALNEDERAIYEKEAEKDVIRFRREMDIYERKRKERLCPSLPSSSSIQSNASFNSTAIPLPSSVKSDIPSGWPAVFMGSMTHGSAPSPVAVAGLASTVPHGPPPLPAPVAFPVQAQFVVNPSTSSSPPPGTEIAIPDGVGGLRKYRVVYGCYRMTREEASDYMTRFSALFSGCQNHLLSPMPPPQYPQMIRTATPTSSQVQPHPSSTQASLPPTMAFPQGGVSLGDGQSHPWRA